MKRLIILVIIAHLLGGCAAQYPVRMKQHKSRYERWFEFKDFWHYKEVKG